MFKRRLGVTWSNRTRADRVASSVEHHVQGLPHVGEIVPSRWVSIRTAIEKIAQSKAHISQEEYLDLYGRHLTPDREKALHLSRYLHDLGVFLHFQDDLRLRRTVILQNRWATEGLPPILEDESIKSALGRFTLQDCRRLWQSSEYADMHLELLALMEKFELCYRLADIHPETWLVPQLLYPSPPQELLGWGAPSDLVLSYRYEFMPRGLVSRLMVRMHRFVATPELSWASGTLFEHQDTQLLVRAQDSGEGIMLRARGKESKALLTVVSSALDDLNDSFSGLHAKVGKWVPCICSRCKEATTPILFELQDLQRRKARKQPHIECSESYEKVVGPELLDGLRLEHPPVWAEQRVVKIFLASSAELAADRDEFDLHVRQLNDRWRSRGLYLEILRWDNFLDAMSMTRLQDEYNKEVSTADIFVSLFMTKTGRYTEEEFDIAYKAFKATGKPLILCTSRMFKCQQAPKASLT